jgi:Uncharacterized conserved protein (COG2071)
MMTDTVECTIERRLLVNVRIEPEVLGRLLPPPLRPHEVRGWAVGGVCFLRLGALRTPFLPFSIGLTTENVAHRYAVEWDDDHGTQIGVYVPRRDTGSRMSALAGGKVFSGRYHMARFRVEDRRGHIKISSTSRDSEVHIDVSAHDTGSLRSQLFDTVDDAVEFFRRGSLSYSPAGNSSCLDGIRLLCNHWDALPVEVEHFSSSVFTGQVDFPAGSCVLDSGLIMRDLPARFVSEGTFRSQTPLGVGPC